MTYKYKRDTLFIKMQIIGHRGACGYQPENTLASFQTAIALGVDMIELDICALADDTVVVMHDATVDRTTDGNGPIDAYCLEEIRALDAGEGQQVPLLTEVLDLTKKRLPINIEIKGGDHVARLLSEIIDEYVHDKGWDPKLFLVSSFDHRILRQFAALQPTIRLGVLFNDAPSRYWAVSKKHTVYSANIDANQITRQTVKQAHRRGFKVFAYTVNSRHQAERLRAMKVDGVFTNYPDRLMV